MKKKQQTIYNFGAGPAMLPASILEEAQEELLDWQGLGLSILEVGHRTSKFEALMEELEQGLRTLLAIPPEYHVLFLGSPARAQFSMIPMNLLQEGEEAGYLISGLWSSLAYEEAKRLKSAYCLASSETVGFQTLPSIEECALKKNTRYVYYTPNETVHGVRYPSLPSISDLPLIADMTSCILTEPMDMSDYALIFAGAQKTLSISGLTLVIVRDDILKQNTQEVLPTILDYKTHIQHKSLYATPPVFACYLALKMVDWIKNQGGVEALYLENCHKAQALYQYIDASSFYRCKIATNARSLVNVCFELVQPELLSLFLSKAEQRGLYALKGHRMLGGARASLYNAMPFSGVLALLAFMQEFAEEYMHHVV